MTALTGLVQNQPWYVLLAAATAMLFALMFAISLCRALVVLAQHAFAAICQGVSTLTEWMFAMIVATVLACVRVTGKLLLALLWHVSRPFVLAVDQARSFIRKRVDALMAGVERQREMRKLWRESGFGTWKEFRWAFENGGGPDQSGHRSEEPPPGRGSPKTFQEACALLGLPIDGSFTHTALNAAYRARMQKAHPDRDGDTVLAAQLNTARDLIRKYKGWT